MPSYRDRFRKSACPKVQEVYSWPRGVPIPLCFLVLRGIGRSRCETLSSSVTNRQSWTKRCLCKGILGCALRQVNERSSGRSSATSDEGGEAFGGSQKIAAEDKLADFVPIDFSGVEAEGDPPARTDVCGQVIALGLSSGKGGVFSWENFAGDGNYAITVVVIQKVGERFVADEKGRVRAVDLLLPSLPYDLEFPF
jgi:hypothetical protein